MTDSRPKSRRGASLFVNILLVGVGCVAFLAIIYLLAKQGSAAPSANPAVTREAIVKLKSTVASSEAAWSAIESRLKFTGAEPTEADLKLLDSLVEATATLEAKTYVDEPRHPALLRMRDGYRGKILHRESLAVEKQGLACESANDTVGAEAAYMKAADIAREIVDKYPSSPSKNIARIVNLESRARILRAKPIWLRSKADEAQGDACYAAGDMPGAIAAYERAWISHGILDTEYRGITQADIIRTRSLGRKRADACADALKVRVLKEVSAAEAAVAARDFESVPALRADAESAIREIVQKYPDSSYARPSWSDPLLRRLVNAAAAKENREIDADFVALKGALNRRDFVTAAAMVEGISTGIARVREQYRGADRPTADAVAQVECLRAVANELALIHKAVLPKLRPLPGASSRLVYESETPQSLYALVVARDNPSASIGNGRPVESVTRIEAEGFCRRLGWILGRSVRLPTEAEFKLLAADAVALPRADLAKIACSIDSGDGTVAPIAGRASPLGFQDALGNVAEWISGEPSRVAGGDAESTLDQLAGIPVREQPATRRSRFVGFRFVVENVETKAEK